MSTFRRTGVSLLAGAFVVYGIARVFGATIILLGFFGMLDKPEVTAAVEKLRANTLVLNTHAFIPMTVEQYLGYSILIGAVLIISALGVLSKRSWGAWGVIAYNVLFAAMFINFQEANAKLIHFGVGAVLAFVLFFLSAPDRRTQPH